MIKCSKCNFENPDDAFYCSSCGKQLNEERAAKEEAEQEYLCPRCGARFVGKQKFCNNCGLEFNWPEGDFNAVPIKAEKSKKAKANKPAKEHKEIGFGVFDYITYGLSLLAIVLTIIAVWLPFAKVLGVSSSELGCKFWFGTFWDLAGYNKYVGYPSFIFFLIAVLCALGFGGYTITTSIMGMLKKRPYDKETFTILAVVPSLVYMSSYYGMAYSEVSGVSVTSFGPGYILALIATIIAFGAIVAKKIYKHIVTKDKDIAPLILDGLSFVFAMVCVIILPLGAVSKASGSSMSIASYLPTLLANHFSSEVEIYSVLTFVFYTIGLLVLGYSLIGYTINETKADRIANMVIIGLGVVAAALVILFASLLFDELFTAKLHIGYAPIVVCVFSALSLSALITKSALISKRA